MCWMLSEHTKKKFPRSVEYSRKFCVFLEQQSFPDYQCVLFYLPLYSPAYWGVLDLTKESLFGCKEITENDIHQLSQDFADHIKWKCELAPKHFQEYFDGNCDYVDSNHEDLKKFDTYVQFM
jgi:hypothetical protein